MRTTPNGSLARRIEGRRAARREAGRAHRHHAGQDAWPTSRPRRAARDVNRQRADERTPTSRCCATSASPADGLVIDDDAHHRHERGHVGLTSPEAFTGGEPTPAWDIYLAGRDDYALLTGFAAVVEGSDVNVFAGSTGSARRRARPARRGVSRWSPTPSARRCQSPDDRPASAAEFADLLARRTTAQCHGSSPPRGGAPPPRPSCSRRPAVRLRHNAYTRSRVKSRPRRGIPMRITVKCGRASLALAAERWPSFSASVCSIETGEIRVALPSHDPAPRAVRVPPTGVE